MVKKRTLKETWLQGLRSNKYTQIYGELFTDQYKACALGVLSLETPSSESLDSILSFKLYMTVKDLNDKEFLSFVEIADWVEKNVVESKGKLVLYSELCSDLGIDSK